MSSISKVILIIVDLRENCQMWFLDVMVSTLDSDFSDPSLNLGVFPFILLLSITKVLFVVVDLEENCLM